MSWASTPDADHEPDYGHAPSAEDDGPPEPTLRDAVLAALANAGFRACRGWPSGRGPFPNEVELGEPRDRGGYEVCVVQWFGASKGSARDRLAGAFDAVRRACTKRGLVTADGGGLRLEVGWAGTPVRWSGVGLGA